MQERQLTPAGDLLQIAITIAAIAVALAALTLDRGPVIRGVRPVPVSFLLSGLPAVFGGMYAMGDLWSQEGMSVRDALGHHPWNRARGRPIDDGYAYNALVLTTWGIYLLGSLYVVLLAVNAR